MAQLLRGDVVWADLNSEIIVSGAAHARDWMDWATLIVTGFGVLVVGFIQVSLFGKPS